MTLKAPSELHISGDNSFSNLLEETAADEVESLSLMCWVMIKGKFLNL